MVSLHESRWYDLWRVGPGALQLRRTPSPFGSMMELREAHEGLLNVIEAEAPDRLLIDLREAPSRNDPEFEERFKRYRSRLTGTARQTGLLLRSRVGALQVKRLARDDGVDLEVFHEEPVAGVWLRRG